MSSLPSSIGALPAPHSPSASRREAIAGGLAVWLSGCRDDAPLDTGTPLPAGFLGVAAWVGEEARTLDERTGEGLDGRLITDLSTVEELGLVQENSRFYIRTAASALLETAGWTVTLAGRVAAPVVHDLAALQALAVPQGVLQFECSGNTGFGGFGLMSAAEWEGVPLAALLADVVADAGADWVRVTGFDTYPDNSETSVVGASWVFSRAELEAAGAFLATKMNGEDLPLDHGYPVRLVVPGWYGCVNIKWVQEIALVDDTERPTSQMDEFAVRTLQDGIPSFAADYLPAVIDVAAVPVRVEKWATEAGTLAYRIVGVTWGGPVPANRLRLHFDGDGGREVAVTPERPDGKTWSLWEYWWEPTATGDVELTLSVDDPAIRTRRLDTSYYARTVRVDEV